MRRSCLTRGPGLTDDADVGFAVEQVGDPPPHDLMIVEQEHTDFIGNYRSEIVHCRRVPFLQLFGMVHGAHGRVPTSRHAVFGPLAQVGQAAAALTVTDADAVVGHDQRQLGARCVHVDFGAFGVRMAGHVGECFAQYGHEVVHDRFRNDRIDRTVEAQLGVEAQHRADLGRHGE